jgi:hypothetical protein
MGAVEDFAGRFRQLQSQGISLIHTPQQYLRTSHLPDWYPLIHDLTPRSVWYESPPTLEQVQSDFGRWPVFMKGERQTSKHQRSLSILRGPEDFHRAIESYRIDPILRWQRVVVREYVPLRLVGPESSHTIPSAFEFRSFWWRGQCAGIGPYWTGIHYALSPGEREQAMQIGCEAAQRIDVPFLVIDLAQTRDERRWIVIECNDGQDSGYAGVAPLILWRHILDIEQERIHI